MALLAQEMDEDIMSPTQFIDGSTDIPEFSLSPNLVKIDREEPRQFLDHAVTGPYVQGKECGNVLLEEVSIIYEEATEAKIDNQG